MPPAPVTGDMRRDGQVWQSRFSITGMDCPSEERMIRLALDGIDQVAHLSFDMPARRLDVVHRDDVTPIRVALENLRLGAQLVETRHAENAPLEASASDESRVLKIALGINLFMFFAELTAGLMAKSTGLVADSLDMFADAAVYGVSLYAVGRAASTKLRAAHFSGWLQMVLALGAGFEVVRRFLMGSEPEYLAMIGVAAVALIANVVTLVLLSRHRGGAAHMKAGWIFTTNDVLANIGVMVAGVLVWSTGSPIPDLVIGAIIALVVLSGAIRILRLKG